MDCSLYTYVRTHQLLVVPSAGPWAKEMGKKLRLELREVKEPQLERDAHKLVQMCIQQSGQMVHSASFLLLVYIHYVYMIIMST